MSRHCAYFTTLDEARNATRAVNDSLGATFTFYRRMAGNTWVVETASLPLDDFVKQLAATGCKYTLTPPTPKVKP